MPAMSRSSICRFGRSPERRWWRLGEMERAPDWAGLLALPGAHLHLYGKVQARPGRKMGHLTITAETPARAREVALRAAELLGIEAF